MLSGFLCNWCQKQTFSTGKKKKIKQKRGFNRKVLVLWYFWVIILTRIIWVVYFAKIQLICTWLAFIFIFCSKCSVNPKDCILCRAHASIFLIFFSGIDFKFKKNILNLWQRNFYFFDTKKPLQLALNTAKIDICAIKSVTVSDIFVDIPSHFICVSLGLGLGSADTS